MRAAYVEAEETVRAADGIVNSMAKMLIGRLRKANPSLCVALKRELRDFNISTKRWK
jgi:hypothetical protein